MPPYAPFTWIDDDGTNTVGTIFSATRMNQIEQGVAAASTLATAANPKPPLVTTSVGTPADGDERYFVADATKGVIWHQRYRAASASPYKWEVVGGPRLMSARGGDITTSSSAYVALTGGPTLAVPLTGEYEVFLQCGMINAAAGSGYAVAELFADATDTAIAVVDVFQGAAGRQILVSDTYAPIALAAGQSLNVKVGCANSGSNRFFNGSVGMMPLRTN